MESLSVARELVSYLEQFLWPDSFHDYFVFSVHFNIFPSSLHDAREPVKIKYKIQYVPSESSYAASRGLCDATLAEVTLES